MGRGWHPTRPALTVAACVGGCCLLGVEFCFPNAGLGSPGKVRSPCSQVLGA